MNSRRGWNFTSINPDPVVWTYYVDPKIGGINRCRKTWFNLLIYLIWTLSRIFGSFLNFEGLLEIWYYRKSWIVYFVRKVLSTWNLFGRYFLLVGKWIWWICWWATCLVSHKRLAHIQLRTIYIVADLGLKER